MAMKFVAQAEGKSEYVTSAATVTVLPENKVRICYLDKFDRITKEKVKDINFADGQKCKIYDMSELPVTISADDEGAEFVLRVKSEGSKIVEFLPENETGLLAKFVGFYHVNGKDTPPIPSEKKKYKEGDADVLQFCALFTIEDGAFAGKTVAQYLQFSQAGKAKKSGNPYSFSTFIKDAEGNVGLGFQPLPNGSTGYKWSDQIYALRHCGMVDGDSIKMPEDNNPLALIEAKLLQANRVVELEVEKGYVSTISSGKKVGFKPAPKVVEVAQHEVGLTAQPVQPDPSGIAPDEM